MPADTATHQGDPTAASNAEKSYKIGLDPVTKGMNHQNQTRPGKQKSLHTRPATNYKSKIARRRKRVSWGKHYYRFLGLVFSCRFMNFWSKGRLSRRRGSLSVHSRVLVAGSSEGTGLQLKLWQRGTCFPKSLGLERPVRTCWDPAVIYFVNAHTSSQRRRAKVLREPVEKSYLQTLEILESYRATQTQRQNYITVREV